MYKNLALMAFAAVATGAMAQSWEWKQWDPNNSSYETNKAWVERHAVDAIGGGDAYTLDNIFDRAPSNVSIALANSLAKNTWQSKMMGDEIAIAKIPMRTTWTSKTTDTNGDMTTTTTTTTTTTEWTMNARPMRMYMERYPRNIDYWQACEIITSNLNDSEATAFRTWFWDTASEGQKDVIVRYIESNAKYADRIVYVSTLPH